MDDIKIKVNPKIKKNEKQNLTVLDKSVDSLERKISDFRMEGPWSQEIEDFMVEWKNMCKLKSNLHSKAGYIYKKKNAQWGLPTILIPISMSPISIMIGHDACINELNWQTIFNSCAFLISGIFSGVYSFFKYGEKMEQFFNFSARYYDVVTEIEAELIKERKFRVPADVFITRIKMLIDNLFKTEPIIPSSLNK